MKVSNLLAAAGALLAVSAAAALAAEACECCKDNAAAPEMTCCDKMQDDATPAPAPAPDSAPAGPSADAPDHSQHHSPT